MMQLLLAVAAAAKAGGGKPKHILFVMVDGGNNKQFNASLPPPAAVPQQFNACLPPPVAVPPSSHPLLPVRPRCLLPQNQVDIGVPQTQLGLSLHTFRINLDAPHRPPLTNRPHLCWSRPGIQRCELPEHVGSEQPDHRQSRHGGDQARALYET